VTWTDGCHPAAIVAAMTSRADLDRALWALRGYNIATLATVLPAGPHAAGVFFTTVLEEERIHLLLTVFRESRLHRGILADPRVAFMCSPGNASRWIQGTGRARPVDDETRRSDIVDRLIEHAPLASPFVASPASVPVVLDVVELKIVEDLASPPLLLDLGPPAHAA
jgi:Pyridoxamine 5'-phosphate oxidase